MLQAVLSMFHSVQSILKSMQKQKDVYEEFVGQQDVTKEILEDVTKEVLEEKEERSHTDPDTTLAWVGMCQALIGFNSNPHFVYQLLTNVTD